ncbi:MAG: hypothetical protein Q9174_006396 [Haloplaca sp. 1 TL-2023]
MDERQIWRDWNHYHYVNSHGHVAAPGTSSASPDFGGLGMTSSSFQTPFARHTNPSLAFKNPNLPTGYLPVDHQVMEAGQKPPETLPGGQTSVTAYGEETIDPTFRVPVAIDQTQLQYVQQPPGPPGPPEPPSPTGDGQRSPKKAAKKGSQAPRLRKACDSCSKRKVKCNETAPCRPCSQLDIPCTYSRPSRRRGPRNKHADAIRGQLESAAAAMDGAGQSSPTFAAQTLASLAQKPMMSMETICPPALLYRLVDDYFDYIHPLIPFPHEPTFRRALEDRADTANMKFLALLASMLGCLVASNPGRPRQHIQALGLDQVFHDSSVLVNKCRKVAIDAQGPNYVERHHTIEDAAIAYFQALTAGYSYYFQDYIVYMARCVTISKLLRLHHREVPNSNAPGNGNRNEAVMVPGQGKDVVNQEMRKRLFWIIFSTLTSFQQLAVFNEVNQSGNEYELIIPPPTQSLPYPDLPLQVDDAYITPHGVLQVPQDEISELVAFNATMKTYEAVTHTNAMDLAYGPDELFDWEHQKNSIRRSLGIVDGVLGGLPSGFLSTRHTSAVTTQAHDPQYPPPTQGYPELGVDYSTRLGVHREQKKIRVEIQKANYYASHLATRIFLIEKLRKLSDKHHGIDDSVDAALENGSTGNAQGASPNKDRRPVIADESIEDRELLVKDYLKYLEHFDYTYVETNGVGFGLKIRLVLSMIMNIKGYRKSDSYREAEAFLKQIIEFLFRQPESIRQEAMETGISVDDLRARDWATVLQERGRVDA